MPKFILPIIPAIVFISIAVSPAFCRPEPFILGADVSWIPEEEARGVKYFDNGVQKDIFQILKDHKFNYIRLRIFNNPTAKSGGSVATTGAVYAGYDSLGPGFCDLAHTKAMARRIKAAGMKLFIDFHYSDNWADPGKQYKPHAWANATFTQLTDSVRRYTAYVLTELKNQGTLPSMVQVGNEITAGMIWPDGNWTHWDNFAELLKAGIAGVKDVDSTIKIVMHIDKGGSFSDTKSWLDNALSGGVAFDVLGQSCYTEFQGNPAGWKAAFDSLAINYPDISFIIAEYSQEKRAANDIMFNLPGARGLGTFIWEPLQYYEKIFTPSGNNWNTNAYIDLYPQMSKDYGNDTFVTNVHGATSDPIRAHYSIVNFFAGAYKIAVTYTSPATTEVSLELYTVEGSLLSLKREHAVAGINRSTLSFIGPQWVAGQYLVALRVQGEIRSMQGVVRLR